MNNVDQATAIEAAALRNDYRIIRDKVEAGSRVLDLGCGGGHLLALLREQKGVIGYGVERDQECIIQCVENGLSVFQGDIDEGLRDFDDQSFDYVVLTQTLSATHHPPLVVSEMLRVGGKAIISFANFAHWRVRLRLLLSGRMPVTEAIPYDWYDTPNIHHLTLRDFALFCRRFGFCILDQCYFRTLRGGQVQRKVRLPNLRAGYGLFVLGPGD